MKYEIKHRYTGVVLFALETESMKLCVEAAVKIGANLGDAYLEGAYLEGANLGGAYLRGAKNADLAMAMTVIVPDGQIIGWKKLGNGAIAKLSIPADAKRSNAAGRKCRAEYADVIDIIGADVAISSHDMKTEYRVGQRVMPDRFDENWMEECAPGIHFFISKIEAENY